MSEIDVELRNVTKEFPGRRGEAAVIAVNNVSLQIQDGEFFALLGPSGCGKTTTLRMIAGFEETSSGEILLRGEPVQDVPPFHRPVNTVFQDYALFPHMTALQNVMFGLEMENIPKAEAQERAQKALDMVQLPGAASRRPGQLSGGQQQRVALARALVKNPTVLLLDEPLGALDLKLRKEMQFELKSMQQNLGITFIYVTHDQEEALTMADRIAVMDGGNVLQVGAPEEIYEKPHTRFVADFIGETNFITGTLERKEGNDGFVRLSDSEIVRGVMDDPNTPLNQTVTLAIRPEKVFVTPPEGTSPRSSHFDIDAKELLALVEAEENSVLLKGSIRQSIYIGTDMRHIVKLGDTGMEVVVRHQNVGGHHDHRFDEGQPVYVFWRLENARILRD
jgi:spermidine/putrescine transport system ATP-binding protein